MENSVSLYCLIRFLLELHCFCTIFRRQQYILTYPQYQIDVPQQNNYERTATIENREFAPKEIPPPIEAMKPEKEPEKHGTSDKEITIQDEIPPTKPFYYVLPPLSQILYYNPGSQFTARKIQ